MYRPPPFGVYAPVVCFFTDDEEIDFESIKQHVKRLLGSGELESNAVIISGCSANSVRETRRLVKDAHDSGADYALVLPPSYWVAAMTKPVIKSFYAEVATDSSSPILIYNFPGVAGGIDLDSDMIIDLARQQPSIVGVKLTCGNLGKLQRISATLPSSEFAAFAGKADFMLPGLVAGSCGVISALANVVPKAHVELVRLYQAGDLNKAISLQNELSTSDWELLKLGISGVKTACQRAFDYGTGKARMPLPTVSPKAFHATEDGPLGRIITLEKQLGL
ncbi:dihydrodipicolinate synthase [Purpureocillium lavendulum]|uniref:Dihydrodipicolinate synthase n=1 Tax=Purpureocillium lavendulum TaxID=1247861 RepID=A0AB34G364_9HYPO|nr:dihydrodipicolinate synthase [Purpureocillium lavendulum]